VLFARSVDTQARRATRTRFLEQLWFCVPLGVALAAGTLARVVDKWLVATWSPDQIGMYTVAAQEVPVLPVIPYAGGVAIAVSMVEAFRSGRIEKAHGLWFEQIRSVSRIVVPASFFLLVIAPVVIPNLFGSRYVAAVLPFQVFAVIGLHRVTEYGMVLRASGRTGDLVRSSIVLLGATLVLGVPAAAFGGIVGVSLSTLAAFGIAWWWILGRVADAFGRRRTDVFPWTTWLSLVVVYGIVSSITIVCARVAPEAIPRAVVVVAVFVAGCLTVEVIGRRRMVGRREIVISGVRNV
jgi:O-antigen/teichoic acid export membrane protein